MNEPKQLQAEANGKLLLFGEHAILYGYPALGLGLDRTLRLTLSYSETGSLPASQKDSLPSLELPAQYHAAVRKVMLTVSHELGRAFPEHSHLSVQSQLPLASGFGSSAALCVAAARLLALLAKPAVSGKQPPASLDTERLWQAAHEAEKIFHGTPSGIDTALALHSGLLAFKARAGGLPELRQLQRQELPLVYGSVPRAANAKRSIGRLGELMRQQDPSCTETMSLLGACAERAIQLLDGGSGSLCTVGLAELADLANQAHAGLRKLGLSTELAEDLLEAGRTAGAMGAKISGAGAGGAFWLLAENRQKAEAVFAALNKRVEKLGLQSSVQLFIP
ncbi:MAG: mevalonate kinase [Spirochaetes bacterium]|nr:mevalonate kinase [Spirochaetota bacterium]MBU0954416.1 mevalonate kinase [Spirochaetota bacterium]